MSGNLCPGTSAAVDEPEEAAGCRRDVGYDRLTSLRGGCDDVMGGGGPPGDEQPLTSGGDADNTAEEDHDGEYEYEDMPDPLEAIRMAEALEEDGVAYTLDTLAYWVMIGEDNTACKMMKAKCMILGWVRSGDLVVEGFEEKAGVEEETITAACRGARLHLAAETLDSLGYA